MSTKTPEGSAPVKRKRVTSSPTSLSKKKKKQSTNAPNLCAFLNNNNVPSIVRKLNNSVHSELLTNTISNSEQTFLFVLATSKEMTCVQPVIIKINETNLEDKEYIKCRIDGSYFVGRVVSTSKNLMKLESIISDIIDKFAIGWKANFLKKDSLIMCCTTVVKIQDIERSDQRIHFLSTILNERISINMGDDQTESNVDATSSSFGNDNGPIFDDFDSALVLSENDSGFNIENEEPSLTHSEFQDLDSSSGHNLMTGGESRVDGTITDVHDVSSETDDELNSNNESECKRKRRKRLNTTTQLITKLRKEKQQDLLKANSEIINLTDMLNESIPTLPVENPLTPVLKNIYKFLLALNYKFNNMNEKAIASGSIPLERKIDVKKVKGKEEISINGIFAFPMSLYAWAISASEPRLVMSRIMRSCIPDSVKIKSEVSDQANETNFIYRIGNDSLTGIERLENGREKIEILIEHCHSVKKLEFMTFQSYTSCKAQIIKALYDFNRPKNKKISLPSTQKSKRQKAGDAELLNSDQNKETEDSDIIVDYLFKTMHSQS